MKYFYLFLFTYLPALFYTQTTVSSDNLQYIRMENAQGKYLTDRAEKALFLKERSRNMLLERQGMLRSTQTAVEMCTNGGFEQTEQINGKNYIKNFLYTIGDPPGPTQCKSISNTADAAIPQYTPGNTNLMATSVPANLMDKYMGDIKAFDQFALKLNHTNSSTYGAIAQGRRFKTNNENFVKFNYKAILQSVYDSSHKDNQAFFKARILNKDEVVVSEFCLVGDEKNCIFTKVPDGGSSYVTLYTAKWQSGILDISAIPNNEEFTIEFMASRCGLGGHFGYAYIDDVCILQSTENFVGSVTLDPLYAICPTLPLNVCGEYTLPNSGGITAGLKKLTLQVKDATGKVVRTLTNASIDTATKRFCFSLLPTDFPDITHGNYDVGVSADFEVSGTPVGCGSAGSTAVFASANDPDANDGWDISFQNCSTACTLTVNTAKLSKCDTDHDGFEDFDLTQLNSQITSSVAGLSFSYLKTFTEAQSNSNIIPTTVPYRSASAVLYAKVTQSSSCFKIIPVNVEVKNPTATISGILNVCSGSTVLKASSGSTYLWSTGETTQAVTVSSTGVYSVTVTDSFGCASTATVSIEPSQTAAAPTLEVSQPTCFANYGTIKVISAAVEYSFDDGRTWGTNPLRTNLFAGTYEVMVKTAAGCTSYAQSVTIVPSLTAYPNVYSTNPKFCGDTGKITVSSSAAYYSYDDGATWTTSSTAENLQPGIYTVRTKDLTGCISNPAVVTISSETLGMVDYTLINPACTVPGTLTINTPADFYTFDGGKTWVTTNEKNNLQTGSFVVGVKNNLGCTSGYASVYLQPFQLQYPQSEIIQPTCGQPGTIYISTEADFYSFDNGASWSTSNMKDLQAGTYRLKVKNAAGCESQTSPVTLYPPRLQYPFTTVVHPTCGVQGSITINTVADFYSFDNGVTWVTTNSKTLPAGNYQVRIKNALGCMSDSKFEYLTEVRLPQPQVTVTPMTCTTKGSISVDTPASFYSINGGSTWVTTNVFNNLTLGFYNVMIKNSQDCVSASKDVYFNQPYLEGPEFIAVSPSCGNIGSITFTSAASEYSIDNGNTWSTTPVFNNLAAGNYYLYIRNSPTCRSNSVYVQLSNTDLSSPSAAVTQPTCGLGGTIKILGAGTSFSINGGTTWSSSPVFTNLSSGFYYIRVKDGTCISGSTSVALRDPLLPDPTYTVIQPTCGVGGSITFTTTSAEYSINGGSTWSSSPVFSNLADGYYSVMIKNSQGCKSNSFLVSLNKYYLPKPTISVVEPTCGNKGSIKILTAAAEYSFNGGQTWTTQNEKNDITSGSFYISIRNAQGCTSDPYGLYVSMNPFLLPRPFVKTVQPTCSNNGSITIVSQAAAYSFDDGATWKTSPVLLNPAPGSYSIKVKNAAGCISESRYVSINRFYLAAPAVTTLQPTCEAPKGSIYVNTIADLYSFDNGVSWTSNPVKNNVNAGSYNILIKNSFGCISQSAYAYISSAPALPSPPVVAVVQPSSCGTTDGSITINSPGFSFTFNDGASWSSSAVKKNIGAGTYIIRVKSSSSGCPSLPVAVTLNSGITIAAPGVTVTQPTCSVSTGAIAVTTSAETYSFDDGLTFVYSNSKSGLEPGIYKIKIKNAAGCISAVTTATVTLPAPLPAPAFSVSQPDCTAALGSIQINTSAAEYSFDNGLTYSTANLKSSLAPGTYNLMVKDAAGCISLAAIATVNVQPITPGAPQISVAHPTGCTSSTGTVAVISPAALYSFDDGSTWITASSLNLAPGTYKVRTKLSAAGCPSTPTTAVIDPPANAPLPPQATVVQPTSCVNPVGTITITSAADFYSFDNGATYTTSAVSPPFPGGTYNLRVKNSAGCESTAVSVTVNVPADTPKTPTVAIQQIDCQHPTAQVTVNETAASYSIDNGASWQASNVFSGLLPKTYLVKIKNTLGCESISTSATVHVFANPTPKPAVNPTQNFCIQQNATVTQLQATGTQLQWYLNQTAQMPLPVSTLLVNGNTYFVSQTLNNCESERTPVLVNILATPAPLGNQAQTFCHSQKATLANLLVSGTSIKWYASATTTVAMPMNTTLQNGLTYFATQTENGCESVQRLPVTVTLVATTVPANDFTTAAQCSEEDGTKTINLKQFESSLVSNSASYTFYYYNENNQKILNPTEYPLHTGSNKLTVEVTASSGCLATVVLTIPVNASPVVNLPATLEYCPGEILELNAGAPIGNTSYSWMLNGSPLSTQQIIPVAHTGTYQVTVTNGNGCQTLKSVVVKKVDFPVITDIKIENNSIEIIASGNLPLEYSIDGLSWQFSNRFYNLVNGNYTAYVRSTNRPCAVTEMAFTIFKISNVFTPNDDGVNDHWTIEGLENYPGSRVTVLDRFGTIVLDQTVQSSFSWNGQYLSRKLPTGTYWYRITVSDGRILSGYVMLKNRN